jgi:hypothetical protein
MSVEPPRSRPSAGAPEDDSLIVDGLELAVAQARTKIPDHEHDPDVVLPSPNAAFESPAGTAAEIAVDSSAVMDVLRDAIARYTTDEAHEQGAWSNAVPLPTARVGSPVGARHAAAGYSRDRRRLAAAVVVLFLLMGGFGYQQFGIGKSTSSVKTQPTVTLAGRGVTTQTRPSTSALVIPEATVAPPPDTAGQPAAPAKPVTTVKHSGTTAPPATDPPSTEPSTTIPDETTTTVPESTTTTTCDPPCTLP